MKKQAKSRQALRPRGIRVKADLTKQAPNNSYLPKAYYEDFPFVCRDCGRDCVWTAEQQKLWYEEWAGPIQSTAIRCRKCRATVRRQLQEQRAKSEAGRRFLRTESPNSKSSPK